MSAVAPPRPRPRPVPVVRRRTVADRVRDINPAWWVIPGALALAAVAGVTAGISPVLPPALAITVLVVFSVYRRPLIAAVLVTAVVPAVAGLGRGSVVPGFKVSELLLICCVAAVALRRPERWRPFNGVDGAFILFAVVGASLAVLHAFLGNATTLDAMLRVGLLPTFLFLAWWTASRSVASREDLLVVMRWVLLVSTVPALLGIAQFFDVPGVRDLIITLVGEGLLPQVGAENARITSLFPISHSLGGYLLVPVVLSALLLLRNDVEVLARPLVAVVLAIDLIDVVLAVTVTLTL